MGCGEDFDPVGFFMILGLIFIVAICSAISKHFDEYNKYKKFYDKSHNND